MICISQLKLTESLMNTITALSFKCKYPLSISVGKESARQLFQL